MKIKHFLRLAMALLLVAGIFSNTPALAKYEERIDFEDGSYAVIETVSSGRSRASKTDAKVYTYYDTSSRRCFSYTLYADFSYTGRTSSATSVNYSVDIYRTGWSLVSHSEYTSGNKAYGNATFSGPTGPQYVSLSLTCDKDGNVT